MPLSLPPEGSRQRQVLDLVCAGNSNKQIAHLLGLSPRTVENHRMKAMHMIGARNGYEAMHLIHADEVARLQQMLKRAMAARCNCARDGFITGGQS